MHKRLINIFLVMSIALAPSNTLHAWNLATLKDKITTFCENHKTTSKCLTAIGFLSLIGLATVGAAKAVAGSAPDSVSEKHRRMIFLNMIPRILGNMAGFIPIFLLNKVKKSDDSFEFTEIPTKSKDQYIGTLPREAVNLIQEINPNANIKIDETEYKEAIIQKCGQLPAEFKETLLEGVEINNHQDAAENTAPSTTILRETTPSGFLFHGPGGTGKTTLIQVIAGMANDNQHKPKIFSFKISDFMEYKYANQYIKAIQSMINKITSKLNPGEKAILVMEECDSLFGSRRSKVSDGQGIFNNFLKTALDQCKAQGIILALTTNHLTTINPQLKRRLIFVPMNLPDENIRKKFLQYSIKKYCDKNVLSSSFNNPTLIDNLASHTKEFSQGNMEELIAQLARENVSLSKLGGVEHYTVLVAEQIKKVRDMRTQEQSDDRIFKALEPVRNPRQNRPLASVASTSKMPITRRQSLPNLSKSTIEPEPIGKGKQRLITN